MTEYLAQVEVEVEKVFEYLHKNPETSWQEHETTAFLVRELQALGLRVTTFDDITGVIGEWGPSHGPVVALRSDIDALWQEVDGQWRANHSCGHDAHMAMVLGAVKLLNQMFPNPQVRIRVLFQPAEEQGNGALQFVRLGAVDDVVYLFGVHLRPIQELEVGKVSAAILHGASTQLNVQLQGMSAHGAKPHLGINVIEVAVSLINALQFVHIDPMIPHSLKVTHIAAGDVNSANVIPDLVRLAIDLRAQTNLAMKSLLEQVESRIEIIAQMYGAHMNVDRLGETVAAEVSPKARAFLESAIVDTLGQDALAADIVTPGAEDFHDYAAHRPELKAAMMGLGCGVSPGLHHPQMTFDRRMLFLGTKVLADAAVKACSSIVKDAGSR